jgi:hypothetical protein
MRREKTQISKIRNEKGDITTNTKEIQGIIRDYFESLYSNKLENLEMDKYLDTYNHPKLRQEDIKHLNISIALNEIEAAINTPPLKLAKMLCLSYYLLFFLFNKIGEEGGIGPAGK